MATQFKIKTIDGRIVHGISWTVPAPSLPSNPLVLAASMPGGASMGVYNLYGVSGWISPVANTIQSILSVTPGAST
jgi:hypothetical protein